ncbi:major type 1 subunit fimbrin (pilin) [Collimonas sp. PA-H2]|uniref:fimbrial protein n=1 Tax=Collimonas sp. PA-H2 TaxID=1881062 RepID=UPI000BFA346C|nr:fimbrial protein [Collimonas sp. PA-H2]PFH11522.1 major type 1 subunit fimbrin (pilin) [Collimonas sp. PA-H2]
MNRKSIIAILLTGSAFGSIANAADGTINFTGNITTVACTVDPTSGVTPNPVLLGNVSTTAFPIFGSSAAPTMFSITLSACPATVTTARAKFDGPTAAGNPNLLALTGAGSPGVATFVGIGIYEQDSSTLIPIGALSAPVPVLAANPTTPMNFIAKYVSTGTVTEGTANATSAFTISYN